MAMDVPKVSVGIGYTLNLGNPDNREFVRINLQIDGIPANGDHDEVTLHMSNAAKAFEAALEELSAQAQKVAEEHGRG